MKRTSLFVALALAIVFAAAIVNVNRVAGDNHSTHQDQHHQKQSHGQEKEPIVDGAVSPGAIPDFAAQEVVMKILASDTPDQGGGDRKKAYLRSYGFDEDAQAALMLAAREYKRFVEPIEKETDQIKNLNWPNPGNDARVKLKDLQRTKENAVADVVTELNGRLQTYRSLDKWTNHIADTVKRKIKGFASELPKKKVSFFRLFPDPFAAYAQAGGCDPTYVYSDGVLDNRVLYGYGSYSAGANNCGHEFEVETRITHFQAPTVYGTDFVQIYLDSGSNSYDGNFFIYTGVEGYCPVALVTFPAGNNSDSEFAAPYINLKTAELPNGVQHNATVNIKLEVTGSNSCSGKIGTLDLVRVAAQNLSDDSAQDPVEETVTGFTVNSGEKFHSIGSIKLSNTNFNGQMQMEVSFTNCPTYQCNVNGTPTNATTQGPGCPKTTNTMIVNKP